VLSVIEESALTSAASDGGRRVREFEAALASYLGSKHVIAVNSGTAALHAALLAAGVGPGDDVLLPAFTFVATANAVVATGARPVFVDIKKNDYTIDVQDMKRKIRRRTKAVIPVHLYGHPCNMEVIELAEKRSLAVIEDACQSLGSTAGGRQTGTLGIMGCFSMYASKVLTAGEGGAVATDDDKLAGKLKMIRNHGMAHGYDTRVLGLNLRLPEMSAAIAKAQMGKLGSMLQVRRQNAELLSGLLSKVSGILLPTETADKKFNWYLYTVAFSSSKARDAAKAALEKVGIGSAVYYDPPVHRTPFYRKVSPDTKLAATEWCARRVLSLPVHPGVGEADVKVMAATLKSL
jgi:dTDP-4-amino-4,6-dideoxygalactose transaminase